MQKPILNQIYYGEMVTGLNLFNKSHQQDL